MKHFLLLLILLPFLGLSQLNINLDTVAATCSGNGSVTVTFNNATIGSTYDVELQLIGSISGDDNILLDPPQVATAETFDITFNTLNAGEWNIKVIETSANDIVTENLDENFSIDSNLLDPTFNASTGTNCTYGTVEITVASGEFTSYRLENQGTGPSYPPQTSTMFDQVDPGQYLVIAEYPCGEKTQNVTINPVESNYVLGRNSGVGEGFNRLLACDTTIHKVNLRLNGFNDPPQDRFPMDITYTVYDENDNIVYNNTDNFTSYWNNYTLELPYGDGYRVVATVVDACGITYSREDNIVRNTYIQLNERDGNCGGKYYNLDFNQMAPDINIKFTQYPDGFQPSAIRPEFDDTSYTGVFTEFDYRNYRIILGDTDNTFPSGSYTIEVTDPCSDEVKTLSFDATAEIYIRATNNPACGNENVTSKIFLTTSENSVTQIGDIVEAEFLSGPASFGPYPKSLTEFIKNGTVLLESVPPGTYEFSSSDNSCNYSDIKTIVYDKTLEYSYDTNIAYSCSSFAYEYSIQSNANSKRIIFQKWNESNQMWSRIQQNSWYNDNETFSNLIENISEHGLYRLIHTYSYYSSNTTGGSTSLTCDVVLEEFEYLGSPLTIDNYFVNSCGNSNTFDLIIEATGVEPLLYKIVSKDGDTNFATDAQESPIFENLTSGTYKVKVLDDCQNSIDANFSVQESKSPRILAEALCNGENGSLRTSGLSQFTTTWTKNGQPISDSRISTNGNVLNFEPFLESEDTGTYVASIDYPTSSTCGPIITEIILTSETDTNPLAGTGQTVSLTSSEVSGPENLFDYLTGPYDNFGTWTEVTDSNLLIGNEWLAEYAATGTYEFIYTVEGTCSGVDTATVIINFSSVCDRPFNNEVADTFTPIGISNLDTHRIADWPTSIPNGFITLESNTKGLTISRMADPENAIADPVQGMLVFDTDDKFGKGCFKLYNGTAWKCIEKACNN